MKVALSIGVQKMIRADLAGAGVMFTIDPDTGFENVVLISGAWGLGENVVQGTVNTDEFLVLNLYYTKFPGPLYPINWAGKMKTMVYSEVSKNDIVKPEDAVINLDTSPEKEVSLF